MGVDMENQKNMDMISSTNKIKKTVTFSSSAKDFDGSRPEILKHFLLVAGFFNMKEYDIQRVGNVYKNGNQTCVRSTKVGSKIFVVVKSSEDCIKIFKNDIQSLYSSLDQLKRIIVKLQEVKEESRIEDREIKTARLLSQDCDRDEEWERTCSGRCKIKKCCMDKKADSKRKPKVSITLSGSREYSLSVSPEHESYVKRLIDILETSIEKEFFKDIENNEVDRHTYSEIIV